MNDKEIEIAYKLKNYHRGRQRAITYKELAKVLRINERELRNVVALLVIKGELIGASQEGYFWITSEEEYQIARAEIISRISKLRLRLDGLERGWEARQVPQKSLF